LQGTKKNSFPTEVSCEESNSHKILVYLHSQKGKLIILYQRRGTVMQNKGEIRIKNLSRTTSTKKKVW
jgi:hypothetical protein